MELNAEQIKKALECCYMQELEHNENCPECPYTDLYPNCAEYLGKDALSLITSQEQRIKELTEENERLTTNLVEQSAENMMLIGENKRLRASLYKDISIVRFSRGNGKSEHMREVARIRMDAVRADTVRKMQERLCEGRVSNDPVVIATNVVAKEMLEEV